MTSTGRRHRKDGAPVLTIEGLSIQFAGRGGTARVVDEVNLEIWPGEIVGLIGESGSGKTMMALSTLGLAPRGARIVAGDIRLGNDSITRMAEPELRRIRGNRIAMVPQDALRALNPVLPVGRQVGEPYVIHRSMARGRSEKVAVELLRDVHLPSPDERATEYPHQYSGGMQQRAMVAMGLALEPELLVADEPTTALDVTVQAQVLKLFREIRDAKGTAIFFITHDLGVVAELCDRVYVIYAGEIMEEGPIDRIFVQPSHPYTQLLLRATPTVDGKPGELMEIPGQIPSPYALPPGCRFADRCPHKFDRCDSRPPLLTVDEGHAARCWLVQAD